MTEMAVESLESQTSAKGVTLLEALRGHLSADMLDGERGAVVEIFNGFQVRILSYWSVHQVLCFGARGLRQTCLLSYLSAQSCRLQSG